MISLKVRNLYSLTQLPLKWVREYICVVPVAYFQTVPRPKPPKYIPDVLESDMKKTNTPTTTMKSKGKQ